MNALVTVLKGKKASLTAKTVSACQLIPAAARKPSVIRRWLLGSYWFYLSVIIVLILMKTGHIEMEPSTPATNRKSQGTGTVVLPRRDRSGPSEKEGAIGPDGRYRIERNLGQGAMGVVHLAKDQLLFRNVA